MSSWGSQSPLRTPVAALALLRAHLELVTGPAFTLATPIGPGGVRAGAAVAAEREERSSGATPTLDAPDPEIADLVRQAQEGSAYAFALLYDRYVDQVFAFCFHRVGDRHTAEDLTADVFTKALQKLDTFTWQGRDFIAWLITIARNRCHDHFKSARVRLETPTYEFNDAPVTSVGDDPERSALVAETVRTVQDALKQLKSEQSEVLYLRFIQQLDVAQTAQIMGKNEVAIRALQYRALKALAKHLDVSALVAV